MGAPKHKTYKRSWRNLLLNTRYQLRFTLFMVGLCAALMGLLGWWVMQVAHSATEVGINNAMGVRCQRPDLAVLAPRPAVELTDPFEEPAAPATPPPVAGEPVAGEPVAGEPGERPRPSVQLEESEMETRELPPAPVDPTAVHAAVTGIVKHHRCRMQQRGHIDELRAGERKILWVLVFAGIGLCIGLTLYGIKMTHKVAGPLHKVTLYFNKLRDGRYDKVYDLRKGDQLVGFYESFKGAHEGLRKLQQEDVAVLRALLADAEAAALGARSPELEAALEELRGVLARKEESLGG